MKDLGTIYIVATPIGNLEDMTYRAVRVLGEVNMVFAEDTRTTGVLLKHYGITNQLSSYNAQNHFVKNKEIIKLLEEGKDVALVSDAGTPGISDPGYSAVHEVRKLVPEARIIPIPGASALTAFISGLGLGTHVWTFYGFLPHKNGRKKMLKAMMTDDNSSVFYESTHRIEKCLEELHVIIQEQEENKHTKIALGRELTKVFEEYLIGTPQEILDIFSKEPVKKKGEFVVMVI